ncbi:MAG: porin family protein [Siculibacillus sp.]|nr:porin family protein [Siculibacillus sp.]
MTFHSKTVGALLTCAAITAFAGAADAADMLRRVPPATPLTQAEVAYVQPSRAFNWTGFYGGGYVEYGFGKDRVGIAPPVAIGMANVNGFGGGLTAGYNYQTGNFVVGLEADIGLSNMHDRVTNALLFGGSVANVKYDWFATVRPRVGYAIDNLLLYATGGLAVGGIDNRIAVTAPAGAMSSKTTRVGFAVGAGVEYAFTQQLSVKAEYLYTNLETRTHTFGPYSTRSIGVANHVRIGLNYHF